MKIINNITDKLSDELKEKLEPGSKLSIAAACFSVYAFEELKTQLEGIDALRFIFTSPTFLAEQPEKAQREFYIPRLNREKTLYGSEFEIRLRNEFTQKAISRECAEWVRRKASFKSNVTSELMPGFMTVENAAPCAFAPVNGFTRADLGCERGGNMFSMINEIDAPESAAYALLNSHNQRAAWEQQYQTAAELFAGGNYKKAAELAEDVPKNIAEQPALLTVAKAGVLLNANTEESLRDGLDLLEYAWDLGSYSEQGTALQAELTARLQETLYEKAISLLHKGDAYAARDCLRELGNYKDAATILAYTHALIDSQSFNVILYRWALESLQAIPPDYNGEFAEEIAALRDALPGKIAEQEQIDAERAAILAQQQQQKPKPPQTFNYGGSTDTGPGSGHSLREDYGDPEDLYEDGGYDDLDEAWDEWEEGW